MNSIVFASLFLYCSFALLYGGVKATTAADTSTLKLLHIVFRHGHRNPDEGSIYDDNPYKNESYYPEGYGQLTNQGKVREYSIGTALRDRYDDFLTDSWNINYLEARTTETNRTKMSLALVLAGLYPARHSQIWSSLYWLPIPYNYLKSSEDKETRWFSVCTNFYTLYSELVSTSNVTSYLKRYKGTFAIMSAYTDVDDFSISDAFNYYFGFATQEEVGYPFEDWVSTVYPEPLHSAAVDYYYLITNTTALRQIAAGYLLKKILNDTEQLINGTLSPSTRKMFLYSAHEMNVASMILSLGIKHITDIPAYGSYVLFEVHEIDGVYGFKVLYQLYEEDDPIEAEITDCGTFCSFDDFSALYDDIIPSSDEECTG